MSKQAFFGVLLVLLLPVLFVVLFPQLCGFLFEKQDQMQITNQTGEGIALTSHHTNQTIRIPDGEVAVVPHSDGHVTVRQNGGRTWFYRDVSVMGFDGTPYQVVRNYPIPFGGGTLTVNFLLDKQGYLYVGLPDEKNLTDVRQKQPEAFPMIPELQHNMASEKED